MSAGSAYHRRPLKPGDRVCLTPGAPSRRVVRVTPAAAYLAGEPREVTVGERTFVTHSGVVQISRMAFVFEEEEGTR